MKTHKMSKGTPKKSMGKSHRVASKPTSDAATQVKKDKKGKK